MPRLSEFYGLVIAMFYNDHEPAHVHVTYSGRHARITVRGARVIDGDLPARALRLYRQWARLHGGELEDNWGRARRREVLIPIEPLD